MNIPQPSYRTGGSDFRSGLARLVRRICVLREQGDAPAAARLEANELAAAVRDFRLAEGPGALTEAELQAVFANEERRVADALVLAELLIPQLAGVGPVGSGAVQRTQLPAGREAQAASHSSPVPAPGSPAIPDLLDAMLAADAAARRQPAGRR